MFAGLISINSIELAALLSTSPIKMIALMFVLAENISTRKLLQTFITKVRTTALPLKSSNPQVGLTGALGPRLNAQTRTGTTVGGSESSATASTLTAMSSPTAIVLS